jgi:hypothetical protein
MAHGFVYRCPNTGKNVQGWVADDPTVREQAFYEAVTCTACAQVHLVEPKTGKLVGYEEAC